MSLRSELFCHGIPKSLIFLMTDAFQGTDAFVGVKTWETQDFFTRLLAFWAVSSTALAVPSPPKTIVICTYLKPSNLFSVVFVVLERAQHGAGWEAGPEYHRNL